MLIKVLLPYQPVLPSFRTVLRTFPFLSMTNRTSDLGGSDAQHIRNETQSELLVISSEGVHHERRKYFTLRLQAQGALVPKSPVA